MAAAMLALSNIGRGHDRRATKVRGEEEEQGRERAATTGENNKNSALPPAIKRRYKSIKKTQQSATKMEAAGTIGCWKLARMF
jgi:hypothetical protein